MISPRVSVLLPVKNGGAYLNAALESIRQQTFRDFECIIINDHSSDDTPLILERFSQLDPRFRWYLANGSGISDALNQAIAISKGELLARQDADDSSHPQRFERQVELFDSCQTIGLVGSHVRFVSEEMGAFLKFQPPKSSSHLQSLLMGGRNPFVHGCVMFRRRLLQSNAAPYRGELSEDYLLWLELAEHCEFAVVPHELYYHRLNNAGLSATNLCVQHKVARKGLSDFRKSRGLSEIIKKNNFCQDAVWQRLKHKIVWAVRARNYSAVQSTSREITAISNLPFGYHCFFYLLSIVPWVSFFCSLAEAYSRPIRYVFVPANERSFAVPWVFLK